MTLGLNKNLFKNFNVYHKNETKKRKADEEVMNGFTEEVVNFNDNQCCETPSKRRKNSLTEEMSENNVHTSNSQKIKNAFNTMWEKVWPKKAEDRQTHNVTTNAESVEQFNRYSNENDLQNNTNKTFSMKSNVSLPTTDQSVRRQPMPLEEKKKKKSLLRYQKEEKHKYRQLLNRHFSYRPFFPKCNTNDRKVEIPFIDLTSTASHSFSNTSPKSTFSPHSSQNEYITNVLDKQTKTALVDRIKSSGIKAVQSVTSVKINISNSTPFGVKTSPISRFQTPKTIEYLRPTLQSQQMNPTVRSTPNLPESTKIFNESIGLKKDYLDNGFVEDLRKGIENTNQRNEQKVLIYEKQVSVYRNKREENLKSKSPNLFSPINKTEVGAFIPYWRSEEPEQSEEEYEDEEEDIGVSDMPVLTPDMERVINNALQSTPPNEVLVEGITGEICRKDMETLKGLNWLNDEIINFYLSLVVERGKNDNFSNVHAFNTFFYKKLRDTGPQSLKRWTRKIDIFSFDFIFIPIHLGMHWCLAVIDFIDNRIQYYDSMSGKNKECVEALREYLKAESLDKKKKEFPMTDWTLEMVKDIPQQMNGSDCGMFTCKYAEYISRRAKINFTQAHMPYFRRRMVYEILNKQLL